MKLLVLSGFLGSGKTTLLLKVARRFTDRGEKVAIIENEAGQTGIDDRIVAAEGFEVRELYSGCVCCSLRHDLQRTLAQLEQDVQPDVVIVEPSGIAAPAAVADVFRHYEGNVTSMLLVVLTDLPRMAKLIGTNLPFFEAAVKAGDIVALTKADIADNSLREQAAAEIAQLNPAVPIFMLSAQTGEGMAPFLDHVSACPHGTAVSSPHHGHGPRLNAIACSDIIEIALPATTLSTVTLVTTAHAFIAGLIADIRHAGHDVLGHIKTVMEMPDGGYLSLSYTGIEPEPQQKGSFTRDRTATASLRASAILCGVPEPELSSLFAARMADWRATILTSSA